MVSNNEVLGKGFKIVEVFDKDEDKVGTIAEGLDLIVKDSSQLEEIIKSRNIKQAILAVNSQVAQNVAQELVKYGIKGILNLTAFKIELPREIVVISVDISAKLQELNFWRKHTDINQIK